MTSAPAIPVAEHAALTRRITLLSVAVAAVLLALKAAAWRASGSVALLASMADSGLDLIASLASFYAVRYAVAPPDREHRFGHGKAEAFASLMQAGLVFASAALVAREAIQELLAPQPLQAAGWAIGVMLVSTVLTLGLIAAQTRVLRRTTSVAVSGDRAHYASDLSANLIVLAGIGGAALGWDRLDAAAGVAVAALLVWGAVGVFREASAQLMDRELPEEERRRIVALMTQDARLTDVHQLRTRVSGPYVHMQMHVDLDPELSLDQAHHVIVEAERRLLGVFPAADVIIHADPKGRAEPHGGAFAEAGGS
ncbi:MAG: cation diffusion facilitator family transporter [Phenylobacterium sp.]